MRMSHVYQPVMIKTLLKSKGKSSVKKIAKELLSYDVSQVEYYEHITKNMVGKVLTSNRKITSKEGDTYFLKAYEKLTEKQRQELIELCNDKIEGYIRKRGDNIWKHRIVSHKAVPGSTRYEVLKRAKNRCESCGVPNDVRSLEVDHIAPKSLGGPNELSNYQALCYVCNSQKSNKDSTDFRDILESYGHRDNECVFCSLPKKRIVDEGSTVLVIKDIYPVTKGHHLIIPKRHVSDYFDLYQPELNSIHTFLNRYKEKLTKRDKSITGFNIGINNGEPAGQTIFHCHVHLIPRRKGDNDKPRGGVRGVIPDKQDY